jgi:DNA polymerase-1
VQRLLQQKAIGFRLRTSPGGSVLGIAFTWEGFAGTYVPLVGDDRLQDFAAVLESPAIDKVGHDLKGDLLALRRLGLCVRGRMFDAMVAHSLAEPDMRHSIEYLSETLLGLALAPAEPAGGQVEFALLASPLDEGSPTLQRLDASWQLRAILEPLLLERKQERVFYEVESPLIAVLAGMEFEGIRVDAVALGEFAGQLAQEMATKEKLIFSAAGGEFNLNSPRQLGQVLFERLKLGDAPKKTRTGQYATDEQTLLALAGEHEVVQHLLDYRAAAKLKTTYADALPQAVRQDTGRVHTTFNQVATSTGRLNSQNPNLQNIPIRRELGQEVRRAFVPRGPGFALLSADYSQIELRIIAALSREPGLLEAFRTSQDVHTATAARVYGVSPEDVTSEMRRKAKMVNYGIAYGISAFGLAQRLRIPRKEAMEIIDNYFRQFAGIRRYMDDTIAFARKHGYVETVTGRRRYLRDINSRNATVRNAAERNAINMPIQGTAADMIKIAMVRIDRALEERRLNTRMLLQVHDELVFDLDLREEKEVQELVCQLMREAIVLEVPIEVEVGVGRNWLEAH